MITLFGVSYAWNSPEVLVVAGVALAVFLPIISDMSGCSGSQAVAVFRLGEEIFALKDLCTHGNAKLSDGYVEDGCVECPLHQGRFDVVTGRAVGVPCTQDVRTFALSVEDGVLWLHTQEAAP